MKECYLNSCKFCTGTRCALKEIEIDGFECKSYTPKEESRTRKIVQVHFKDNVTLFDFFTDLELQQGDIVVCDTKLGYKVATVQGTIATSTKAYKWVVCKIDVSRHEDRLKREAEKEIILQQLRERKEKLKEMEEFRRLAVEDDVTRELVRKFGELEG